ncbi:MAG: hypothetical protein JSW07_17075 [bacterium]|nr:MAG: hypothetical protein JSW07_17075 [bacterium]
MPDVYRRKISAEEAKERYILVQKGALDFFPRLGKPFTLKLKDKELEMYLESVEVWSMGPKKPQYSYRIDAKQFWDVFPLHFGKIVTITKEDDKVYTLS